MTKTFNVWAAGGAHLSADVPHGRQSLTEAIRQSEGNDPSVEGFDWDIMLDVGDLSGNVEPPDDETGAEVVAQYAALQRHRREDVYNLAGDFDASGPDEPAHWWFQRYVDPTGSSTRWSGVDADRRPFAVEGTWERYRFQVGNVLFLVMSSRNDGGPPRGRDADTVAPAGAVTAETFDWWVNQVETNQHLNIVTAHHHPLKDTTVGSGPWEAFDTPDAYGKRKGRFHDYVPDNGPMGASYLYWVDGNPDAQAFERYLATHPNAIDLWVSGHTHVEADEIINGRTHLEERWGVTFLNVAGLSAHHPLASNAPFAAMSRLISFVDGATKVRVGCYLHTDTREPKGFVQRQQRTFVLRHPFVAP